MHSLATQNSCLASCAFFFFFFRRGKPDLLSGLNAEEKNKCGNMVEKKLLEEEENYGLKSEVSFLGREISYLR